MRAVLPGTPKLLVGRTRLNLTYNEAKQFLPSLEEKYRDNPIRLFFDRDENAVLSVRAGRSTIIHPDEKNPLVASFTDFARQYKTIQNNKPLDDPVWFNLYTKIMDETQGQPMKDLKVVVDSPTSYHLAPRE